MGTLYTAVSVNNYNSNPPSDDGSQTASNRLSWATHLSKIGNPIKTAFDTSETNTAAAFAKTFGASGITSVSTNYTVSASDQGKLVVVTGSGGVTITTPDATSVNSPFAFGLSNESTGTVTFAGNNPGVQQNIDSVTSITVPAGNGLICATDGTNWQTYGQNFTKSFPPPGSYKNLSIKVTGNTAATLAADYITVTDGSKYQTLAFNQAINLGTTGAGALDTGTIALSTWYAVWAIAKADGTTSAIASTSGTAPTMPSGYTFKARVGWLRTRADLAQLLGTWQLGRRARYIVGLGALAHSYVMSSGAVGTYDAVSPTLSAISVSNFAPTTASIISCTVASTFTGAANSNLILAPSTAYSGTNNGPNGSSGNIPTFFGSITSIGLNSTVDVFLESTNVYWCSSAAGGALLAAGWEDNI